MSLLKMCSLFKIKVIEPLLGCVRNVQSIEYKWSRLEREADKLMACQLPLIPTTTKLVQKNVYESIKILKFYCMFLI